MRRSKSRTGLRLAGDVEALGELYDRHGVYAYRGALALLGDPAPAEAAVEAAFLEVWGSGRADLGYLLENRLIISRQFPEAFRQLKVQRLAATYRALLDSLADADISVVALSVDDEATTRDLIARHGLRFPVGHSADAAAIARATGAFVNPGPPYLQSTGFVLDPGGRVIVSVYSSGAIGRLIPQDVAGLVGYLREHAQAS